MTTGLVKVIKRNGSKEVLDLNKIHKVVSLACENISNVSVSEIELRAELQFFDGIKTSEIQNTLIKSAADLISEDFPNYQYVASKLINYDLRKQVYNAHEPWKLFDIVKKNVELGYYDKSLLENYSEEEYDELDKVIRHDRDYNIVYAGMEQFRSKYLVKNKLTKTYFETPQVAYMLIGAMAFINETKNRLKYVKEFYNSVSNFDFTLPSPQLAGVRTPKHGFASCVLVDVGDDLNSISAAGDAILKYASNRAGLGINIGRLRAVGSPVRNGEVVSTGVIPFARKLINDLKAVSQGGLRTASATINYQMWHLEYENLIVLKNSKGTEDTRIRNADYSVQINKTLLNRFLNGENITLFSPSDVPGLYEAFFRSNDEFEKLYVKYENDSSIRKKVISAQEAFAKLAIERKETGRIYIQFVDNTNDLGTYDQSKSLIYMNNLCTEVTQVSKPLSKFDDENGEISICTLASYNLGTIKSPDDFERRANIVVRYLDNLLDLQVYPNKAAKNSTDLYRHLGIGLTNLAYFLAKHNQTYTSESAPEFLHPFIEAMSYYTIKASMNLAKERGVFPAWENTKWSKGIMPIDKYRSFMDSIVQNNLLLDWDKLREEILENGLRHATLMAVAPVETSSQVINSTNGVEPPQSLVSYKNSKDGSPPQVVPEIQRLKKKYELLWDQKSPRGYLNLMGVINKFICQSISTNISYNSEHYENGEMPLSVLLGDIIYSFQLGLKTLYYQNTYDGNKVINVNELIEQSKQKSFPEQHEIIEDEACEACVI